MKYIFSLLFSALIVCNVSAQELNCSVRVQHPQVQNVDPAVFKTLETSIYEFMNQRSWTEDEFSEEERIECTFNLTITEDLSPTRFKAEVIIQASRPVFNSGYKTVIFEHKDKDWEFDYAQYEPLAFNRNSYTGELTQLLGFYAYAILAFDYDSYSLEGGTPYFNIAREVVLNAADGGKKGWGAFDSRRNRYWIVDNFLDPRFAALRECHYNYHIKGLDMMHEDAANGRKNILMSLEKVGQTSKSNPNSMAVTVFSNTKSDEIYEIFNFKQVPPAEKSKVGNTMVRVDPSNAQKFLTLGRSSGRNSTVPSKGTVPAGRGN